MLIRQAQEEDVDAIAGLWVELVAYHSALDDNMPQPAPDGFRRYAYRIRQNLLMFTGKVLVAEDGDELVGYLSGAIVDLLPDVFEDERGGFLADIYVKPSYRSQGIGQALVNAFKEWLQVRGVQTVEWYVAAANTPAIRFWHDVAGGRDMLIRMRASTEITDS